MERFLKSRYKIGEKISENPFSVGYKGFFLGTNKPVIIKIYKRGTLNSSLINRMKQKVKDFSHIKHHGIAQLIDGDYGWQGFYYVREYVLGKSLEELLSEGHKIDAERAVAIAEEVSRTLEVVHGKGIIHGGLKPSNIFIDTHGMVKLSDFVIEGQIKEAMPQKAINLMLDGKYAAPEELIGQPAAFSSDIYALGLIMCEMMDQEVVAEEGLAGSLQKLRSKPELSGLPKYLQDIMLKALQADPLMRFSSISEFRESLEHKNLVVKPPPNEEYVTIFQNTMTRFDESDTHETKGEKETDDQGDEKRRNWIIILILTLSLFAGLAYVFFMGR
jgi:serine/threonine protein kinase